MSLRGRAALSLAGALVVSGGATSAAPAPGPARVQAAADEFKLVLSRGAVREGPVLLQLVNYGEDDHDLALRRSGGPTRRIAVVRPGELGELEARLRAGRFTVWCTLSDHRARGMRTTLVVRPHSSTGAATFSTTGG